MSMAEWLEQQKHKMEELVENAKSTEEAGEILDKFYGDLDEWKLTRGSALQHVAGYLENKLEDVQVQGNLDRAADSPINERE